MDEVEKAEQDVIKSFEKVKQDLGRIFVEFEKLRAASAFDDVSSMLKDLEDVVKDVRTGGLIGSGAKSHQRSLKKLNDLKNP